MTEAELQKRIAYQVGLTNGNIVIPNIFLPAGEICQILSDSDAGIMAIKDFKGRCARIMRDPKPRRHIEPIKEQKLYDLLRIGCMKWYTANRV